MKYKVLVNKENKIKFQTWLDKKMKEHDSE